MNIGIQSGATVNEIGIEKAYKAFAEAGFKTIDWNLDSALPMKTIMAGKYRGNCIFEKDLDDIMKYYEAELNVIKNNGLSISQVHAPFPCFVIGASSRVSASKCVCSCFQVSSVIGICSRVSNSALPSGIYRRITISSGLSSM